MQMSSRRPNMSGYDLEAIEKKVIHYLKHVYDPEIPVNIYDLGLIYKVEFEIQEKNLFCFITMTLTSPGCPVADSLLNEVKQVVSAVDEVDETSVDLTFEPIWDMNKVSDEGKELLLMNGAHIPQY